MKQLASFAQKALNGCPQGAKTHGRDSPAAAAGTLAAGRHPNAAPAWVGRKHRPPQRPAPVYAPPLRPDSQLRAIMGLAAGIPQQRPLRLARFWVQAKWWDGRLNSS
jgi:hypothetical protein